jgi:hypothetical protein
LQEETPFSSEYLPAAQLVHCGAPKPETHPKGHKLHEACPCKSMKKPIGHIVHSELLPVENLPELHVLQKESPLSEYFPASQSVQEVGPVWIFPAAHFSQKIAPCFENLPSGHEMQDDLHVPIGMYLPDGHENRFPDIM